MDAAPPFCSPAFSFFILGDYQWALLSNSNKQLPLLFPSVQSRGLCHVDVRTDWWRHLQLYRLHLSHLERSQYSVLMVVWMSDNWWLYTAFLRLLLWLANESIWRYRCKSQEQSGISYLLRQFNSCLTMEVDGCYCFINFRWIRPSIYLMPVRIWLSEYRFYTQFIGKSDFVTYFLKNIISTVVLSINL